MTDEERISASKIARLERTNELLINKIKEEPCSRDFEDLSSTLMVGLPLSSHRVGLQRMDHTFNSEEAINNLDSLKCPQSNCIPDPKDPSRLLAVKRLFIP